MKPHAAQVADSITLHHVLRFVTNSLVEQQQQQQQQQQQKRQQKQNHHHHHHHQMGRSNAFRVKPKENTYIGSWFQMFFLHTKMIQFDQEHIFRTGGDKAPTKQQPRPRSAVLFRSTVRTTDAPADTRVPRMFNIAPDMKNQ